MATYRDLRAEGITTRAAAALTGLSRATAGRKPVTPLRATRVVPANRLSPTERKRVVTTLDSARFVDQPPLQVYAQLLDEDTYLCSVSSMYRILGEHSQVRERRRLARHPARVRPELVATGPGQVFSCYADIGIRAIHLSRLRFVRACRARVVWRGGGPS